MLWLNIRAEHLGAERAEEESENGEYLLGTRHNLVTFKVLPKIKTNCMS